MGGTRVHAPGIFLRATAVMVMTVALIACNQTSGTARGVVTAVDGSLEDVTSFMVLVEGSELDFTPTAEGNYDFPLSHLREHG